MRKKEPCYTCCMTKSTLTLIIGILVAIMPYLGFPLAWKNIFYTIAGLVLVVMIINLSIARRRVQ